MAAAMDNYLNQILGVNQAVTRTRIIQNGFHSLASLTRRDVKHASKVCSVVRKITTGPAVARIVSVTTEDNLGNLTRYARYRYITQRPMDFADATLNNLDELGYWSTQLEGSKPTSNDLAPFTDGANKKVWFETIKSHLQVMIGDSGMPLSYVLREDPALPAVDPGFGLPDFEQDVASRGRHDGHFWRGDNRLVWLLIKKLTEGTNAWSCVQEFARTNNGRGAYFALVNTYMGPDIQRILLKRAEATLSTAVYDGRSKSWTWTKHVSRYREAFKDMATSGQELRGRTKVTKLLASFQMESLRHLSSTINNDPALRENFEAAQAFIQGEIGDLKTKNGSNNRNLSSMESIDYEEGPSDSDKIRKSLQRRLKKLQAKLSEKGKGGGPKKGPFKKKNKAAKYSKSNPGAYIPSHEWAKLSEEEQAAAREARRKAGIPTRSVRAVTTTPSPPHTVQEEPEPMEIEEVVEDAKPAAKPTGPAGPSNVGALKRVPPQLLVAPQPKEFATTQRQSLYAVRKVAPTKTQVAKRVVAQQNKDVRKVAGL